MEKDAGISGIHKTIFQDIISIQHRISSADIIITCGYKSNLYFMCSDKKVMTWAEFYSDYYNFIELTVEEFNQAIDMVCSKDNDSHKLGIDLLFKSKIIYDKDKIIKMYERAFFRAPYYSEYKIKLQMIEYRNSK